MVVQLNEIGKGKNDNENNLEELLRKSDQLNSSKSIRLIDQNLQEILLKKNSSIEKASFSCNRLGKSHSAIYKSLPKHLQVFLFFHFISMFIFFSFLFF